MAAFLVYVKMELKSKYKAKSISYTCNTTDLSGKK